MIYKVGDRISFEYKGGRVVIITVTYAGEQNTIGELRTRYIGKSDEWDIGQYKVFNNKEMQDIKIINKDDDKPF